RYAGQRREVVTNPAVSGSPLNPAAIEVSTLTTAARPDTEATVAQSTSRTPRWPAPTMPSAACAADRTARSMTSNNHFFICYPWGLPATVDGTFGGCNLSAVDQAADVVVVAGLNRFRHRREWGAGR